MYTPAEFKETALKRGYARIGHIQLWMKQNPKDEYTEDDLIEVYRFADREPLRREPIKMSCYDEEEAKQLMRDSWL